MMLQSNHLVALFATVVLRGYEDIHNRGFVFVETDKGILRGEKAISIKGDHYFSFKGIPYAEPPIGDLRFKGPQEGTPWNGVREAIRHGEICPHYDIVFKILRGNEDCLFLNVYSPTLNPKHLQPVMFWIHGGMFMVGSGNDEIFGPDYFMKSGIVLVTINYRLGALGFLSTGDDDAPGNAGMKDQVAALRWVQRNIAKFGGDPNTVTIFGGSTGASCVEYHLLSPMSTGLFSRAISQSGSAINDWGLSRNVDKHTIRLAEALGGENISGNTSKAVEFLRTVSYKDIVKVQRSLETPEEQVKLPFIFVPSIDKHVKSEEIFLPYSPLEILESGNYNKVPYIIGYNSREGSFFMNELSRPETMKAAMEDTGIYIPSDIKGGEIRNEIGKSIRKFYFHDKPIGHENISNLVDLYSDSSFIAGITRSMRLHVKTNEKPTYLYVFTQDNQRMNLMKLFLNIHFPGATHGDELGYLFHQRILFWRTPTRGSKSQNILNTMIRLWTNFAKYGNPTPAGDPLDWKPLTSKKIIYLNITGEGVQFDENPYKERYDFWKKAYQLSHPTQNELKK